MKNLDIFLGKAKLPPQYHYAILEKLIQAHFSAILQESFKLAPVVVYETIKQEFSKNFGEQDVLISALCTVINTQQKIHAVNQQKFSEFVTQNKRQIAEPEVRLQRRIFMTNAPAVSVVIPMYNAERYIRECLDSILNQTLTDFEVIVVNDCSTDSSPAIVESCAEKFGGRLTLINRKKNFGGAALPRNMGINLACGEYIQLIDNDDFLTQTALEELYTLAKNADADVVYTGSRYSYNDGKIYLQKSNGLVAEPTLEVDTSQSLLQRFFAERGYIFWTPWTKFVRRRFLVENEITFPKIGSHEDLIWTIEILCCVKRFLNVPNTVYCWRESGDSITRSRRHSMEHLKFWVSIIRRTTKYLDDLWRKYDVLKENPAWLYKVQNYLFDECFMWYALNSRIQVSSEEIFEALRSEFVDEKQNLSASQVPYLYSRIDALHKQLLVTQQNFEQFAVQNQKELQASRQKFKELAAQVQTVIDELEKKTK